MDVKISYIVLSIMISSIVSMMWFRNSIIQMLLSLELLLISCFMAISLNFSSISSWSILLFLSIMVSGSALGLSFLVSSSRQHHSSSTFHLNMLSFDKINSPPSINLYFQI